MADLQYCKEFITLARTQNYLEAAEDLYMSQSTLSRHIQSLEKSLGQPLFSRNTRKVDLTEFGSLYLEYAQQIVDVEERFQNRLHKNRAGSENSVCFALGYLGASYGIPEALAKVAETHPEIQIDTSLESPSIAQALCLKGSYDFIMQRRQGDGDRNDEFVHIPYMTDEVVLLMAKKHRLAKYERVPFPELIDEKFIAQGTDSGAFPRFSSECIRYGFQPKVEIYNKNIFFILDYVSLKNYLTFLSKADAKNLCGMESVVYRGLEPSMSAAVEILYPKGKTLTASVLIVLNTLIEEAKNRLD